MENLRSIFAVFWSADTLVSGLNGTEEHEEATHGIRDRGSIGRAKDGKSQKAKSKRKRAKAGETAGFS
ncbi:MAG: hypothetical protein D6679_14470 [Candidatus Hydrogenedentota bacterium]|nr:MAG: hypothetical protein D6679_14470 [Candidatus Hydrogenedentota bacterium]